MYLPLSLLSCPEKIGLPSSNGKAKIGKRTIAGRLLSKLLSCMNTIATERDYGQDNGCFRPSCLG